MQKLLIVVAIQFCLPWAVYGIQQLISINWSWLLENMTVVINSVCAGSLLGLMRPRWKWMLTAIALTVCYWAFWFEVKLIVHRDALAAFNVFEMRWFYLKILIQLAAVSFGLGLLLSRFFELVYTRESMLEIPHRPWQFGLRDLLIGTVFLAGLVGTALFRFKHTEVFQDFLGIFSEGDAICLIATLALFYLLLWRTWRWRWVALGVFYVAVFLLSFLTESSFSSISQHEQQFTQFVMLLLGSITVLLYRFAGLRIDWRRKEPAIVDPQPAGVPSCKNC